MKIAVLGTGGVGRTIASALYKNHEVRLGSRDPKESLARLNKAGESDVALWSNAHPKADLLSYNDACDGADLIVNCTPGMQSVAVLKSISGEFVNGKTLLDIANPLDFSNDFPPVLTPGNSDSLGEEIQRTFPEIRVVKSLNTMNAGLMVNPKSLAGNHNVFVSGNSNEAKAQVKGILAEFGWQENQILDLGDISTARGTEQLLPIWLRLWQSLGTVNFNFNINLG